MSTSYRRTVHIRLEATRGKHVFVIFSGSEFSSTEFSRPPLLVRFDHESLDIHPAWVIIKVLLKQISLFLLPHSRIRVILLTCPDSIYVILQSCKESSAGIMRACKITQIAKMEGQANIISVEIFAPFQFVPVCVKTREHHN